MHLELIKSKDWPAGGLEDIEICPVCGSAERRLLYTGLTDRAFRCAPGKWNLHQCLVCHSAYLDPRPTPETISLAYERYYTHAIKVRGSAMSLNPLRRLIRAMANGYRNRRYGGNLQPTNWLGGLAIALFPRYRKVLDRELRHLPPLKHGMRLLDVGFGDGAFLRLAQQIGWGVCGVDPDPVAVENARILGVDVRQGAINAFGDAAEQFDAITMNHTIEHVHNPHEDLFLANRLLKPNGTLYIQTPNIHAYCHRRFKQHWRGLEIPRHLVIFSQMALDKALRDAGYKNITQLSTPSVYAHLAGASRAMQKGLDPYSHGRPNPIDILTGLALSLTQRSHDAEFLTVCALK